MNFSKIMERELDGGSNNNNTDVTRKHDMVLLNSKHDAFVRIIPLGDKFFAHDYRQIFVNYTTKEGKSKNVPLFFPGPNDEHFNGSNDELYTLLRKTISYNYNYRSEHPEFKKDILKLQDSNYNANMQTRHEVVTVKVDKNGQMEKDSNGYPVFRGMSLPNSAYLILLDKVMHGGFKYNGKDFPTDLSFIDANVSYPVSFHFNGVGAGYDVQVRPDLPINEKLPDDYLEKDGNNYVHMDNPELFTGYVKETSPAFYNNVLNQLKESLHQQAQVLKQGNPYQAEVDNSSQDDQIDLPDSEDSIPQSQPQPDTDAKKDTDIFPNDDDLKDSKVEQNPEQNQAPKPTNDYSQSAPDVDPDASAEDILNNLGI